MSSPCDITPLLPTQGKIACLPYEDLRPNVANELVRINKCIGGGHVTGASNCPLILSQLTKYSLGVLNKDILSLSSLQGSKVKATITNRVRVLDGHVSREINRISSFISPDTITLMRQKLKRRPLGFFFFFC